MSCCSRVRSLETFLAGPDRLAPSAWGICRRLRMSAPARRFGSHAALADGGQPDGFPVKGNAGLEAVPRAGQRVLRPHRRRGGFATRPMPRRPGSACRRRSVRRRRRSKDPDPRPAGHPAGAGGWRRATGLLEERQYTFVSGRPPTRHRSRSPWSRCSGSRCSASTR